MKSNKHSNSLMAEIERMKKKRNFGQTQQHSEFVKDKRLRTEENPNSEERFKQGTPPLYNQPLLQPKGSRSNTEMGVRSQRDSEISSVDHDASQSSMKDQPATEERSSKSQLTDEAPIMKAAPASTLINQIPFDLEVQFPLSSCHNNKVTCIALDKHTGSQMVTGSSGDYTVKIWDMNFMNKQLRPNKEFKPFPGYPVQSLSFSADSEASMFLACCGNN